MIGDEAYHLQLSDFKEIVSENWQNLRNEDEYCDVTLVSNDGKKIKAHKFILASVSAVLRNTLANENPQQQILLYLRGVTYSQIMYLLDFFYKGEITIDPSELDDFLAIARDLQVKGISEEGGDNKGSDFVKNALTPILKSPPKKKIREGIKGENMEEMQAFNDSIQSDSNDCYNTLEELPRDENSSNQDIKGEPINIDKNNKNSLMPYEEIKQENFFGHPCDQCSYKTYVRGHLNQHIRSIHEGIRYPCTSCNHRSKTKSALNQHVKNVHEGIKYNCPQCDLQTGNKHYLTQHIGKFHDQTVYTCSQCDEPVTGNYKFNQHMKSRHNDFQNE